MYLKVSLEDVSRYQDYTLLGEGGGVLPLNSKILEMNH